MSSASNKNAGTGLFFLIALVVAALVGLGVALVVTNDKPDNSGTRSVVTSVNETPAVPAAEDPGLELPLVQLDGEWTAEENGSRIVATVQNGLITMVMQNEGSQMTYWHGTFKTAESPGATILSTLVEINEIVMSSATEKNFVVGENSLSFELTAMGMTTTVVLNRV